MWTSGYIADSDYTYGYFPETSTQRIRFLAVANGIRPPIIKNACELGFGQGIGLLFNAAVDSCEWYGTDFNPNQAAFVQSMADVSNIKVNVYAESFEKFSEREDLPKFDLIVIHGIWRWIPPEARKAIRNFIDKNLNYGGMVYLSYNAQPGWSVFEPIRRMMLEYVRAQCPRSMPSSESVVAAIKFCENILLSNSTFNKVNPFPVTRLKSLFSHSPVYLAHEYLNENSVPMFFSQVKQELGPLGLRYLCSADYENNVADLILDPEQIIILSGIMDEGLRENTIDIFLNTWFRRDIWIKGAPSLSQNERYRRIKDFQFVAIANPGRANLVVKSFRGIFSIDNEEYKQLLSAFSEEGSVVSGELIFQACRAKVSDIERISRMLIVLLHCKIIDLCPENVTDDRKHQILELNKAVRMENYDFQKINYNVSPVTGQGYKIDRFTQLFSYFYAAGFRSSEEMADKIFNLLYSIDQGIKRKDIVYSTKPEMMTVIKEMADNYITKDAPRLINLGLI